MDDGQVSPEVRAFLAWVDIQLAELRRQLGHARDVGGRPGLRERARLFRRGRPRGLPMSGRGRRRVRAGSGPDTSRAIPDPASTPCRCILCRHRLAACRRIDPGTARGEDRQ